MSPSAKRAWIEMISGALADQGRVVALCAEGVDRTADPLKEDKRRVFVALCEEGVDRNVMAGSP